VKNEKLISEINGGVSCNNHNTPHTPQSAVSELLRSGGARRFLSACAATPGGSARFLSAAAAIFFHLNPYADPMRRGPGGGRWLFPSATAAVLFLLAARGDARPPEMFFADGIVAAQMLPDPSALGSWILAAGIIITAAAALVLIFRRTPPIESEFATKAELDAVRSSLDTRFSNLDKRLENMQQEFTRSANYNARAEESRAGKIHNRVDLILGAVSDLNGTIRNLPCLKGGKCEQS